MKKITVFGKRPLHGEITVSGSKNAALPILFATLATKGVSRIENVPDISDVRVALELISGFGALIMREGSTLYVDTRHIYYSVPNPILTAKIRASTYLLGALLSAFGKCPNLDFGGCNFADRPIDLHLYAFEKFGAKIGAESIVLDDRQPAEILFAKPSVGASANALIVASATDGESVIRGHAAEPHIMALADFLRSAGAEIDITEEKITVKGACLHGGSTVIPGDMIEAGSYLAAGAVTGGCVGVRGCPSEQMTAFVDFLRKVGAKTYVSDDLIFCVGADSALCADVLAEPYPAFPTDLQPIAAPLLAIGAGGTITDRVFPSRFGYLKELARFGVRYEIKEDTAYILPSDFHCADVTAPDLRGGMSCLIAALGANGESHVFSPEILFRGYEKLEEKLLKLGADIKID